MRKFILALSVLVFAALNAQAQVTCTSGQSPVWSANGWTCATPGGSTAPLPPGAAVNMTVANAGVTGTTVNRLAKLTGAPSTAVISATTDTENALGICTANCGTTGNATIAIIGQVTCDFDGATTAGDYVVISATTAGKCHDAGSSFPTSGATYGRVLSTNGAGGAFVMELMTPDIAFQNAGNGKSKPGGSSLDFQYNNSGVFGGGPLKITGSPANSIAINTNSSWVPSTDGAQDLGSASLRWRDLNFGGAIRTAGNMDFTANSVTMRWDGTALSGAGKDIGTAGNRWLNAYIGAPSFATNAPAQITTDKNNYNPGAVAYYQLLSTDASHNITGWTQTATPQDGLTFVIVNVGAQNIVIQNENAGSSANNRFTTSTGADITLSANQAADVFRDVSTLRWRVFKRN